MSQNSSSHYHQLRQALQQELQVQPVQTPMGSAFPMKKFLPWLVATPVAAASLVGVLLWQTPQSNTNAALSLSDFIAEAQAAMEHHPDQVLHQKYRELYVDPLTDQQSAYFMETWSGSKNYASEQVSMDGTVLDKRVEVYDSAAGKQRAYDLHTNDPLTNPANPDNQVPADGIVCGVNTNDFPELAFDQQVNELASIMYNSHSTYERMSLLQTMIDQGHVTDLGTHNGQRGLEIQSRQQTFQYWFNPSTYSLKSYKHLDAQGDIRYQLDYSVDEYVTDAESTLPAFTNLSGLTEAHLYTDVSGLGVEFFDTHTSGCYNQNGEKISNIAAPTITVDENGDATVTFTNLQ